MNKRDPVVNYHHQKTESNMSKRARDMAFRHFNKGVSLIEKGLHEDALDILEQAEEQAKEADSPQILVAVLQTYADLLFAHERKDEALERYISVSDILEKEPEHLSLEQRANMYSNMALALENAGNKEEARKKYDVSSQDYRKLIGEEPDNASYLSNAVSTLNNMGALLADMGRNGEALDAFEEAFDLHERTSDNKVDDEYQHKRVTILENLMNIPLENATGVDEERYARLLEQYAEINTDEKGSSKMSTALQNIARILEKEGKTDEAFIKLEEALDTVLEQFDAMPEEPENRKVLVEILRDMNRLLENEKSPEKQLEKYELMLNISRKLLASMPENTAYQLNVAFALDIISNLLKDAGRIEEATRRIGEAVDIAVDVIRNGNEDNYSLQDMIIIVQDMISLIELAAGDARPGLYSELLEKIEAPAQENIELGLICADIYNSNGMLLAEKGSHSEALDNFKKAFNTYQTVSHATGDSSKMNAVQASIAQMQFSLGQYDEALDGYMELVRAGNVDREYADRIEEILSGKEKKAEVTGNVEILKTVYDSILDIRTELLGMIPDPEGRNAEKISELQEKIADLMVAMGMNREALLAYEQLQDTDQTNRYHGKILKLLEKIRMSAGGMQETEKQETLEFLLSKYNKFLEGDGNDANIEGNRAAVIENIAFLLSERQEAEEAGYMYDYAIDAYTHLSELEPESFFPLERIASINTRIAELAVSVGDREEAQSRYEKALGVYSSLIDADPSSIGYQLDHASVLDGMGALYLTIEMHNEAKWCYENALKAYGRIMENEPENPSYRSNVTITLENLGYVLELMGRKEDALWMYENARKIEEGIE
ncbi:tetratricopeptide repeat protein [Methanolobus sp. WCC4]|uniref:tetratricopeptide repeat protein n=1 Tax=Methanolobus sp. WCC4 TaxID=3125784 RepID=UPI0030F5F85E